MPLMTNPPQKRDGGVILFKFLRISDGRAFALRSTDWWNTDGTSDFCFTSKRGYKNRMAKALLSVFAEEEIRQDFELVTRNDGV